MCNLLHKTKMYHESPSYVSKIISTAYISNSYLLHAIFIVRAEKQHHREHMTKTLLTSLFICTSFLYLKLFKKMSFCILLANERTFSNILVDRFFPFFYILRIMLSVRSRNCKIVVVYFHHDFHQRM